MIYDITQEVFSCRVFPGDPVPEKRRIMSIREGGACNLTTFSMCAHNGTHVDAPFHFVDGGKTVDQMGLMPYVGPGAEKRLLIAGRATVTAEAARVFAEGGLWLLGNESQTVGPEDAPREVHLILLGAEVTLLEGIMLAGVPEGRYFLSAAPLNLGGCDGAPCRAYLMTE